ncbi:hypothetical protein D3C80_1837110 [compost metagenome]
MREQLTQAGVDRASSGLIFGSEYRSGQSPVGLPTAQRVTQTAITQAHRRAHIAFDRRHTQQLSDLLASSRRTNCQGLCQLLC